MRGPVAAAIATVAAVIALNLAALGRSPCRYWLNQAAVSRPRCARLRSPFIPASPGSTGRQTAKGISRRSNPSRQRDR